MAKQSISGWILMKAPFRRMKERLFLFAKIIGDNSSEASGVIVFNLRYDYIENLLNESFITDNGRLFLVSPKTNISTSDRLFPKELFEDLNDSWQVKAVDGKSYHLESQTFDLNQWRLVAVFPDKDLQKSQSAYLTFGSRTIFIFYFLPETIMVIVVGRLHFQAYSKSCQRD
ncbi:hypothetical protein [uncultured Enterococcus sp.]|uniref:hypothetical protein n=1 Tax=uncultured Enterococcus sp. TaxID=167972 RepID=UPI002AA85A22|nr:hypothetical protein [uncultured Enterococcus sp.]